MNLFRKPEILTPKKDLYLNFKDAVKFILEGVLILIIVIPVLIFMLLID